MLDIIIEEEKREEKEEIQKKEEGTPKSEEERKKEERKKRIENYFRREEEKCEFDYNISMNPDILNSSYDEEINYNEGMKLGIYTYNPKEILQKLQDKTLDNISDEYKRCIICLEDFKVNDTVIYLPCLHFFHRNCITQWIEEKAVCPLCKNNIII